jgi:hypothetical protein
MFISILKNKKTVSYHISLFFRLLATIKTAAAAAHKKSIIFVGKLSFSSLPCQINNTHKERHTAREKINEWERIKICSKRQQREQKKSKKKKNLRVCV